MSFLLFFSDMALGINSLASPTCFSFQNLGPNGPIQCVCADSSDVGSEFYLLDLPLGYKAHSQ